MWLSLNSLAHVIVEEGLEDHSFIVSRTENIEAFKKVLKNTRQNMRKKLQQCQRKKFARQRESLGALKIQQPTIPWELLNILQV